jgi:predicted component of type VI protein secretion system
MPEPTADPPGWAPELKVRTSRADLTLRGGSVYRIGRDPNASIVLDDLLVSRQHALLRPVDGTWVLEDSGSTNGTWVGSERVSRIEIRGVVVVRIGHPDDGVLVRLEPAPRTPEALGAEMLPFILAAWRADGYAVLARPRESAVSADATLGRAWLQDMFGRHADGEPLPPVLAEVIDQPGNADSRAVLSEEVRAALVENERLATAAAYVLDTRAGRGSPAQPQPGYPPDQGGYPPAWGGGYGAPQPAQGYQPQGPSYPAPQPAQGYQSQGGAYPAAGPSAGWQGSPSPGTSAMAEYPAPADDARRYLKGQCPGRVRVGEAFSVLATVVREVRKGAAAPLAPFAVPSAGRTVVLVLDATGLEVLSRERQQVHVPAGRDSDPVMFELRATEPGPAELGITAWAGGTFLGRLNLDVTATRHNLWRGGQRDAVMAVDTTPDAGAVSLVVRRDPRENAYRFEFRDADNPAEVTCHLAFEPGPRVEQLIAGLDAMAHGRAGFSAAETRDYLANAGIQLWTELIPAQLRAQFWERQGRISQLTVLSDSDTVPWELLYPLDPGHDAGFLVEQFPVTRVVFGRRPARSLALDPAWFVVPQGSPTRAYDEVSALSQLLSPVPGNARVIGELTPLLELVNSGNFGLLHFACHNTFDAQHGSAISLDRRQFTPLQMNRAAVSQALAGRQPTVFINACRSAGMIPSYHQLDGWARKFLEAGAGAFIGSLWAVRDSTARDFASELYRNLRRGTTFGESVRQARLAAANEPADPTWLAYAAYGDPHATLH